MSFRKELTLTQMIKLFLDRIENIVVNGEKWWLPALCPCPQGYTNIIYIPQDKNIISIPQDKSVDSPKCNHRRRPVRYDLDNCISP